MDLVKFEGENFWAAGSKTGKIPEYAKAGESWPCACACWCTGGNCYCGCTCWTH